MTDLDRRLERMRAEHRTPQQQRDHARLVRARKIRDLEREPERTGPQNVMLRRLREFAARDPLTPEQAAQLDHDQETR